MQLTAGVELGLESFPAVFFCGEKCMSKVDAWKQFLGPRMGRPVVPGTYRANFWHLYMDIAWFALTAATAMSFVGVFITRQGATAFHLGLLSAGPGVVSMLLSIPAGRWLARRSVEKSVLLTGVLTRLTYLPWVVLPFFLAPLEQVWALLALTILANIPGAALSIGFNTLFAEAVPLEWRGHVAGRRNALYAVIFIIITLLVGWILKVLTFPLGYQVIFALGVLGAGMSTYHLSRIKLHQDAPLVSGIAAPKQQRLSFATLRGPFGKVLAALVIFHLTLFLPSPLFPLYMVNNLHLSDPQISLGTALFYVAMLSGSLLLNRLVRRWGNQKVTALGAASISCYPLMMAAGHNVWGFLLASPFGGMGWALAGGAMMNWVLERVAPEERGASLVWYNLAVNGAMLLGSLLGSAGGDWMGVRTALFVFAGARLLAALYIFKRG